MAGSRPYGQSVAITHLTKATAAQMSLVTAGEYTTTGSFMDWTIGSTQLTTDNSATADDLIIAVTEVTEGSIDTTNLTVTLAGSGLTELVTNKTYNGSFSATTATTIFNDDSGIYGSIAGGGSGDSRSDETVNEGLDVTTTSGDQRGLITRLHWLGS